MSPSSHVVQTIRRSRTPAISEVGDYTWHNVRQRLSAAGVRPTRQRMVLTWLLFREGDRHISAEMLHREAASVEMPVSLATVYNTLHQFAAVGLLREIVIDGAKKYFDTNASTHHHFLLEDRGDLLDVPSRDLAVERVPTPPDGYEIARVDVVFRLRRPQG